MPTKWIQFTVCPESVAEFSEALATLEAASKAEPGCIAYAAYQRKEDQSIFTVLESWTDEEAFEAHRSAPHTSSFKENCGSMITEKSAVSLKPVGRGSAGS